MVSAFMVRVGPDGGTARAADGAAVVAALDLAPHGLLLAVEDPLELCAGPNIERLLDVIEARDELLVKLFDVGYRHVRNVVREEVKQDTSDGLVVAIDGHDALLDAQDPAEVVQCVATGLGIVLPLAQGRQEDLLQAGDLLLKLAQGVPLDLLADARKLPVVLLSQERQGIHHILEGLLVASWHTETLLVGEVGRFRGVGHLSTYLPDGAVHGVLDGHVHPLLEGEIVALSELVRRKAGGVLRLLALHEELVKILQQSCHLGLHLRLALCRARLVRGFHLVSDEAPQILLHGVAQLYFASCLQLQGHSVLFVRFVPGDDFLLGVLEGLKHGVLVELGDGPDVPLLLLDEVFDDVEQAMLQVVCSLDSCVALEPFEENMGKVVGRDGEDLGALTPGLKCLEKTLPMLPMRANELVELVVDELSDVHELA
mmetsp:Transcript_28885/g.61496  ORF Transcript_28885/g.61496 Transcript_28885/m.61496 type:complete len:428 (+) Transcript_28885:1162-2445(+)